MCHPSTNGGARLCGLYRHIHVELGVHVWRSYANVLLYSGILLLYYAIRDIDNPYVLVITMHLNLSKHACVALAVTSTFFMREANKLIHCSLEARSLNKDELVHDYCNYRSSALNRVVPDLAKCLKIEWALHLAFRLRRACSLLIHENRKSRQVNKVSKD